MDTSFRLWDSLSGHRKWILVGAISLAVSAALASFLIQPTYRAQIVFFVQTGEESTGLAQLTRQVSVAALAGFLGTARGDRRQQAIAVLQSREFAETFMRKRNLPTLLFPDLWDAERKAWKGDGDEQPSMSDAYRVFDRKIRRLSEDRVTGTMTLSIEWSDPKESARWANEYVAEADAFLRQSEIAEAQRSIEYLKQEVTKAPVLELQEAIYRLTEEQVKRVMLARVRDDFAFKVVDPAVAPDRDDRAKPNRAAMTIGGFLIGLLLAGLIAIYWDVRRRAKAARIAQQP